MAAPSGTTWGSIVGDYGRIGIYIGISNTNTQTTVTISTWFWSKYSCDDSNNSYYYNNNATSATSKVGSIDISTTVASGDGWSTSNQVKLGESTYTYDRGTSAVTRNCAIKLTDVDRVGGQMTHTRSYTIPALASYTVSYNANGGTGAPSAQTKYYGIGLTISDKVPTRTGYTFNNWALSKEAADNGTWYYKPSSTCGQNNNLTLYAVWVANSYTYNIVYKSSSGTQLGTATVTNDFGTTNTISPKSFTGYTSPSSQSIKWDSTSAKTITFTYTPITYNVTINCNGGSGVSSRTYTIETTTFTLGTPTRAGYTFNGWTGSNGTTAQKTVSISKGSTGAKSYTAQWTENVLTISYYSNYATSAFDGALNTVGADKNVEVYRSQIKYDDDYSTYGMANYSTSGGAAYMTKIGYTATGYWQTSDGKSVYEDDKTFTTGQSLAQALGKDISNTSTSVNVYAQWRPNILTIKFHANGGKVNSEEYYIDNDLISLISSSSVLEDEWTYNEGHINGLYNASTLGLTREGYDFLGWKVGASGTTIFDQDDSSVIPTDLASDITTGDRTITLYAVWDLSGVVYIDNGIAFEPYLPYIDNGSTWDLYLAYIDDGTEWKIIS